MPNKFGDQHRANMKRVKDETKALKRGGSKAGMEKRCGQCKGSGQMPQVRLIGKTGRGACTRCGGSGQVDA